nr:WAT1-related protein At5g40230-like [Ipomoea trifida]
MVSIIGALIATLYKWPQIVTTPFQSSTSILNNVLNQSSTWVLGGFLMTIDTIYDSFHIHHRAVWVGSIVMVVGFYFVIWGKAREGKMIERNGVDGSESSTKNTLLLHDDDDVENRETTSVQSL